MEKFLNLAVLSCSVLLIGLTSCKPKASDNPNPDTIQSPAAETAPVTEFTGDGHNSRISVDWNGIYKGTIPCADCGGIQTELTLMEDGSFERSTTYLGKDGETHYEKGNFTWDDSGSNVTLALEDGKTQEYKVGENRLFHLDQEGNRITGDLADNYTLIKNKIDPMLENKKWVLTELMGKEMTFEDENRQAFLMFDSTSGRVSGHDSCNRVMGSYEIREGNRLSFGRGMASTMMACPDMEIADGFNEVMNKVDNYTIADGVLSLNKARMAPLARFKMVTE
ncbi:MAG: copper resistance protein NlpE N-terminal domain-containing protein [Robiginitalea sp.]|uniref:copper resistance protein NlpE N-terminal domain-containing protein n=1 Tax=Robiginitalea sp. TaxID=1902411 RepID=UPI003C776D23